MSIPESLELFSRILRAQHKDPSTISSYTHLVSVFLDAMNVDDTDQIQRDAVRDYFLELSLLDDNDPARFSSSTLNTLRAAVSHFLQAVVNPPWSVGKFTCITPVVRNREIFFFSDEQVQILLDRAMHYIPSPSVRKRIPPKDELLILRLRLIAMIYLGFDSGLRISEVVSLRFQDILPSIRKLHIVNSKRGKSRYTNYSECAAVHLNRYILAQFGSGPIPKEGYIFPGQKPGHFLSSGTALKYFRDLLVICGFDPRLYRFHSLRHGFTMSLINHDVPVLKIAALLGHASLTTTMRYYKQSGVETNHVLTPCAHWKGL